MKILTLIAITLLYGCAISPYNAGPHRTPLHSSYSDRLEATNWCQGLLENVVRKDQPTLTKDKMDVIKTLPEFRSMTLDCLQTLGWL